MVLRRAILRNASIATLDQDRYAVAYKHHLDWIDTNPNEKTLFYQYRPWRRSREEERHLSNWAMEFKRLVERTRQLIIAEPEWDGGKLMTVGFMDCGESQLVVEIKQAPVERIKIAPNAEPHRGWVPDGYEKATHMSNHADMRR